MIQQIKDGQHISDLEMTQDDINEQQNPKSDTQSQALLNSKSSFLKNFYASDVNPLKVNFKTNKKVLVPPYLRAVRSFIH